ncbi:MAG: hypothetical protein JW730_20840 [Anaerolineales bacterium]|nr:hypothetical protein [Anaerolineales bacterium]
MTQQASRYSKARKLFLSLFILSTILALGLFFLLSFVTFSPGSGGTDSDPLLNSALVVTVGSCLTSIVTFVGFVSTTVLAWRREAGEKRGRDLEIKLKEIELDKAKIELEKLRAEQQGQSRKKTK